MILRSLIVLSLLSAAPVATAARPLITHSEETAARLCLSQRDTAERLATLCRTALAEAGVTQQLRSELTSALGDVLHDLGEIEEAEAVQREAVALAPRDTLPLNRLGWLLWDTGREGEAAETFRRSVDLRATQEGMAGLGSALFRSEQSTLQEAFRYLNAAVAIDPDYDWALQEKGWLLHMDGQHAVSEYVFRQILTVNPDDWNGHFGLATALGDQGKHEAALEAFGRAAELNPEHPWIYSGRSETLRRLDRNAQAIRDADRFIDLEPNSNVGYVEKARALTALQRRAEALESYEVGLQVEADGYLYFWYADLLADDGQLDRAMEIIELAVARPDSDASIYYMKAYIANKMQAFAEALRAADEATSQDPEFAFAHYQAAVALARTGDLRRSQDRFDLAMQRGLPDDMVGEYISHLITAGFPVAAMRVRSRY